MVIEDIVCHTDTHSDTSPKHPKQQSDNKSDNTADTLKMQTESDDTLLANPKPTSTPQIDEGIEMPITEEADDVEEFVMDKIISHRVN